MKNLLLLLMVFGLVLAMGSTANAGVIAKYDAGPAGGDPNTIDIDPVLQGWSPTEVDDSGGPLTNVFFLQPDGTTGYNAVQLNDQHGTGNPSPNDNPGYQVFLTAADFQAMYDDGWVYEVRFRSETTGSFFMWGITVANDPGWGLTAQERVGFGIGVGVNNAQTISPIGGTAITLADNSNAEYHTIRAVGGPASSLVDLYVDGVWNQQYDIKDGTSNSSSDNRTGIQSGSSGGTGRIGNFNFMLLRTAKIDVTTIETDGGTEVTEGDAVGDFFDVEISTDPNSAEPQTPTSDVTINLVSLDSQVTLIPSVLTVTAGDANDMLQTVNVVAIDDEVLEGLHEDTVTITTSSSDTRYDGLTTELLVTINDNDGTASFTLSTEVLQVTEEPNELLHLDLSNTETYEISIPFPPVDDVTVAIADAFGQVTVTSPVVFTAADWTPKTVTVTAINDAVAEETPHFGVLEHTVTTTDLNYGVVEPNDLTVLITDNEPLAPISTVPHAWYLADKGTISATGPAVDEDALVLWGDQSGNGRNLNRVGGTGPVYEVAGPALRFDTGSLWDDSTSWGILAAPKTIFVVVDDEDGVNNYYFDSTTSAGRSALFAASSTPDLRMYAGSSLIAMDPFLSGKAVHTAVFGDPNSMHYFNGVLQATGSAGTQTLNGFMAGARYTNSSRLNGTIQEIIVYDTVLSEAEQQQIESYLMAKWLKDIEVYESLGETAVLENDPNTDSIYYAAIGNHTALSVTATPTGPLASEIELDSVGAGNPQTVNFAADTTTDMQTVEVAIVVDNSDSEGPRVVPVVNTSTGLDVDDVDVILNDDERYCNDGLGQVDFLLADLNEDCYVNLADLQEMASQWLDCTDPFFPGDCVLVLP